MATLKELIELKKTQDHISYEKMARVVDISRNQFTIVLNNGFTDRTTLKTIRGFAGLLDMPAWELLRLLGD